VRSASALVPLTAVTALALTVLTACGSSASTGLAPTLPSSSAASTPALPTVQPCDALDAKAISTTLGATVTIDKGSASAPVCALRPNTTSGAAFDMNYQWFYVNGLETYFKTASVPKGKLSDIKVPGADAGKLIINSTAKAYRVTGYIQNGALVQSVNGAGAPSDAQHILAATKVILAELSAGAPRTPAALASPTSPSGS
jgi:hypothetical protein